MQRLTIAVVATLVAALAVVSLSAAAHQHARAKHRFPHRIVSLSPTVTEDLFALGAGKQVVAVDQDSNYPQRAPRTSLSGVTPNVEAIASYHPDLVLISYNPGNFASQLRQLGIKVVNEAAASNLKQAYGEILGLGRLTGHARVRKPWCTRCGRASRRSCAASRNRAATCASTTSSTRPTTRPRRRPSSAASTGCSASGTSPTPPTTPDGGYPQLSGEYIIAKNPQLIVLADTRCCGQSYATVAARPGWSTISAVQHHRVVGANDDVASRWGPRIVQFARSVARIAEDRLMAAAAGRVEAAPRVEARGVGLRAGLVTLGFLVAALAVGLAVGPVHIGVGSIVRSALSYVPFLHVHQPLGAVDRAVLWQLRAPRVALAALVGGMLAVAGASYQGVFRNPLCDPYLLGVAGGAGLGATLAIVYASAAAAGGNWTVPLARSPARSPPLSSPTRSAVRPARRT